MSDDGNTVAILDRRSINRNTEGRQPQGVIYKYIKNETGWERFIFPTNFFHWPSRSNSTHRAKDSFVDFTMSADGVGIAIVAQDSGGAVTLRTNYRTIGNNDTIGENNPANMITGRYTGAFRKVKLSYYGTIIATYSIKFSVNYNSISYQNICINIYV